MRPYGVKVLIIEPGTFKTSMLTDAEAGIRKMWDRVPEEKKKELGVKSLNSGYPTTTDFSSSTHIHNVLLGTHTCSQMYLVALRTIRGS